MLSIYILFFFAIYTICEFFKFKSDIFVVKMFREKLKLKDYKEFEKKKEYNVPVLWIKAFSISICFILIVINRFTKDGIMDRSMGLGTELIYLGIIAILVAASVFDVIRASKVNR